MNTKKKQIMKNKCSILKDHITVENKGNVYLKTSKMGSLLNIGLESGFQIKF